MGRYNFFETLNMSQTPLNKSVKRKTFSPEIDNSTDTPRKQRALFGNTDEVNELAGKLLNEDIDLQQGMRLLIKLQLETNEKINNFFQHLDKINQWLQNLDEAVVDMEDRICSLEKAQVEEKSTSDLENIKRENVVLKQKLIELEDRSRRNNIVISGVAENGLETWEQTEKQVADLCAEKLEIKDLVIERAHRIGKRNSEKPRMIVCKLLSFKDKERIKSNGYKLKDTGIFVNDDYSEQTRKARFHLRSFARDMKSKGATSVKMNYNTISVDSKLYCYDFVSNSVTEVPRLVIDPLE